MAVDPSVMVWLPKGFYAHVGGMWKENYIWSPVPLDESLPPLQTSFIYTEEEERNTLDLQRANAEAIHPRGEQKDYLDHTPQLEKERHVYDVPEMIPKCPGYTPGSETKSDLNFPSKDIACALNRGNSRRRQRDDFGTAKGMVPSLDLKRKSNRFSVRLDLNLDIELELKASINGDLMLSGLL